MRIKETGSPEIFPTSGKVNGEYITNIDTTLRDGLQSRRYFGRPTLNIDERLRLVSAMYDIGVRNFEVFSPNVNGLERESLAAVRLLADSYPEGQRPRINAHVRCHEDDINSAIEGGVDGIHVYMGVAQYAGHQKSPAEVADRVGRTLREVRSSYPGLYIRYSTEDAFRSDPLDRQLAFDAAEPYVNTFGIPDTVGVATEETIKKVIKEMQTRYPNKYLEGHFHNDRGESLHNSLIAAKAGMSLIDTSIWGWAERTGITSFGNLLLRLYEFNPNLLRSFNLKLIFNLNQLMSNILKVPVPESELVSQDNATHCAGVHTDAVMKNPNAYRSVDLSVFGVPENQFVLNPYSGWHHVQSYLLGHGYRVSDTLAKVITNIYKDESCRMGKDNTCESILWEVANRYHIGEEYKEKAMKQVS